MINRAIIIVLDGFGVGELPDANTYGDEGSNTLKGIYEKCKPNIPNMKKLGLYNLPKSIPKTNATRIYRKDRN